MEREKWGTAGREFLFFSDDKSRFSFATEHTLLHAPTLREGANWLERFRGEGNPTMARKGSLFVSAQFWFPVFL